ncbi:hypothetical protein [Nocardia transvalensis]|uniref:hypothetical protein n=1 Tax=Nocardia transvalensis TaxID=37333 RepID=UPI001894FE32|nr:hypothetical protein [Nocardia transvalensis]MBF6328726.1 hypothetical protein [Nocardia transvalensis]
MPEPPEHPVFHDGADQLVMLIALLDAFPGQRDGVLVPIHPKARGPWAEVLYRRGVRVHPELMEELPVSAGDHPEAAWLNPSAWVPRSEFAQQQAPTASSSEQHREQMCQMLQALDPKLAARIDAMTDDERRAARAAQAPLVPEAIEQLQQLGRQFWHMQQANSKDGGDTLREETSNG